MPPRTTQKSVPAPKQATIRVAPLREPEPPKPRSPSLEAFLVAKQIGRSPIDAWFEQRPEIKQQTLDGFSKYPSSVILRWLTQECEFPFARNSLYNYRDRNAGNARRVR